MSVHPLFRSLLLCSISNFNWCHLFFRMLNCTAEKNDRKDREHWRGSQVSFGCLVGGVGRGGVAWSHQGEWWLFSPWGIICNVFFVWEWGLVIMMLWIRTLQNGACQKKTKTYLYAFFSRLTRDLSQVFLFFYLTPFPFLFFTTQRTVCKHEQHTSQVKLAEPDKVLVVVPSSSSSAVWIWLVMSSHTRTPVHRMKLAVVWSCK